VTVYPCDGGWELVQVPAASADGARTQLVTGNVATATTNRRRIGGDMGPGG
jgi:hypothetical protein